MFINAADHFEKDMRQNNLLPEHIDKMVNTYKNRTEEDRYSRRMNMEEIERNNFNLNISHYVSKAIEEEKIDLQEVNKKLVDLDKVITKAREAHDKFLKELRLPPICQSKLKRILPVITYNVLTSIKCSRMP